MKRNRNIRAALLMSAAAVFAAPAVAQDAVPVVQVPPPPVAATLPAPAQSSAPSDRSATPVNPEAAAAAEAEAAERAAERRATRRAAPTRRAVAATAARTVAPAATAPRAPAPAAPAPAPAAEPVVPAPVAAPATAAVAERTTRTETQESGAPVWPLALIAALIVAAGAFFFLRARRARQDENVWAEAEPAYADADHAEPAYVEPAPVHRDAVEPSPVAVAPLGAAAVAGVVAGETSIEHADAQDVAALTAGTGASDRPWLEFAMRPVRAGTSADEALVEIELTVGNAGGVAAQDVRVSTFMLAAGNDAEMERLLIEPRTDAGDHLTIAAGEGARVDATLVMNRTGMDGEFRPVIVADARYRLPDGSEGRTSASFLVGGATDAGGPAPIDLDRNLMRDDVEAALYRAPERV
ncbi:hypothetical protein ASG29_09900 [Sphingomonas sp. Leaf412]|uniref:hypothetical protein n=1 Tax=Sphingomonas sp. Leaf412 TaxID=1736370 RepID=UPI0006F851BB|nr:hypothetical protein [Sphingomonas sp. Leaf412]KQT32143.1 hypothetical protein ASG29_09900 [Sphingomonas sp. Leaf412]